MAKILNMISADGDKKKIIELTNTKYAEAWIKTIEYIRKKEIRLRKKIINKEDGLVNKEDIIKKFYKLSSHLNENKPEANLLRILELKLKRAVIKGNLKKIIINKKTYYQFVCVQPLDTKRKLR